MEHITDSDYQKHVYGAEAFHCDAGDIILADDVATNEHLRCDLREALWWYERMNSRGIVGDDQFLSRLESLNGFIDKIGRRILLNALSNGYSSQSFEGAETHD